MKIARVDLNFFFSNDKLLRLEFVDQDGEPFDATGYTFRILINYRDQSKNRNRGPIAKIDLSLEESVTTELHWVVTDAQSRLWAEYGDLTWQLDRISPAGSVGTWITGNIFVHRSPNAITTTDTYSVTVGEGDEVYTVSVVDPTGGIETTLAARDAAIAAQEANETAFASRSVLAGAGLEGGGTLAADRTVALSTASQASLALADNSRQAATTRAAMQARTVPAVIKTMDTQGYSAPGDGGGATYKRVDSEPTHEGKVRTLDRFLSDGTVSAANGGWWEIASGTSINLKMFGARGDGATDDTAAINAALQFGAGGDVVAKDGNYVISGLVTIPLGTRLRGPGTFDIYNPGTKGATISIRHTDAPGVLLGRGAHLSGIAIWYPDQVTTSPPIEYDWAIQTDLGSGVNNGVTLENLLIHNAYKGIDFGGDFEDQTPNTNLVRINGLRMYAIHTGVRSAATLAEMPVSDCVFSPAFWSASVNQPVRAWAMANGVGYFHFEGTQGFQFSNCQFFGHRRALYFSNPEITDTNDGAVAFQLAVNCTFDGLRTCVETADKVSLNGSTFTGCLFLSKDRFSAGDFTDGKGFYNNASEGPQNITFTGCQFLGTEGSHVYLDAGSSTATHRYIFEGCLFQNANSGGSSGEFYNIYCNDSRACLIFNGAHIYNANASTVTNFRIVNARSLTIDNVDILDTASVPFVVTTLTDSPLISNLYCESANASTWPALELSATVPSAATMVLPVWSSPVFLVTGATGISSIAPSWAGRLVTLKFNGALTVTSGSNLLLQGNFVCVAGDTLTLFCDGVNWREVSRTPIILPGYTAAQIADVTNAVNTSPSKRAGWQIRDTTNNRVMMARGSADGSQWDVIDGSASVTPS